MSAVLIVLWVLAGLGNPWFLWVVAPWGLILLGRWISGGHPDGNQHHQHGHHDQPPGELPGDQGGSPGESGPDGPDDGPPRPGR